VVVFRSVWAVFIHSNVRLPLGPLKLLLGAPHLHHWHHERSRVTVNYGNLAPWTDLLFGTHHDPPEPAPAPGLAQPLGGGYLRMMLEPLGWPAPRDARAAVSASQAAQRDTPPPAREATRF